MPFKIETEIEQNPLDELAEIRFELSEDQLPEVLTELSFGRMQYDFSGKRYQIGLATAYLSLQLEGFKSVIGSKYGSLNTLELDLEELSKRHKTAKIGAILSALAKGTSPSAGAGLDVTASAGVTSEAKEMRNLRYKGIRTLPADKWLIEDWTNSDRPIVSTVLNGDALCVLKPKQSSNRFMISMLLYCSPADIVVSSTGRTSKVGKTNKERIIACIAAKAMSAKSEDVEKRVARIELCRSEKSFNLQDE